MLKKTVSVCVPVCVCMYTLLGQGKLGCLFMPFVIIGLNKEATLSV